jgi:hypothetical protein
VLRHFGRSAFWGGNMNLSILSDLRGVIPQMEHAGTPKLEQDVPSSKGYVCNNFIELHGTEHLEHLEHRKIAFTDKISANKRLWDTAESTTPTENVQPDANVKVTQHLFPQGSAVARKAMPTGSRLDLSWSPEIQSLVSWFMELESPTEPFYLEDHRRIVDPEKFFSALRMDIKAGPEGARGKHCGALIHDLMTLKQILH